MSERERLKTSIREADQRLALLIARLQEVERRREAERRQKIRWQLRRAA